MGLLSRRHGVRTARMQAALFHARERRLELLDPSSGLFRTHTFTAAQGAIDTEGVFPNRLEPVTIALVVKRLTTGSNGILFELGSSTRGFAAALDGDDLIVGVGEAAASADGVTLTAVDALPGVGKARTIVVSIVPGLGSARAWVDGQLVAEGVASSGSFGGDWADTDDGRVADIAGTVIDRIPVGQRVALANASIVGNLSAFAGQRPAGVQ